jgi:hypothetical protein
LQLGVDASRTVHVEDRRALVAEAHAGVNGREKAARPQRRAAAQAAPGAHHDECREVLRLRAKTVERPRTDARAARLREAGVEENLRRRVVELIGVHRADKADVIHDLREMRQHFRKLRAGLTVLRELEARSEHGGVRPDERVALAADHGRRERLAFQLREFRLVVEELELTRRAGHEEMNDTLGLAGEMRLARRERVC